MKKIIAILLAIVVLTPSITFARGGSVSSGGRSSSFSSSSSRSSYSSSSSRSSYTPSSRSTSGSVSRSTTSGTSSRSTGSTSLRSLFGGSSAAKTPSISTSPSSTTKTATVDGKKSYIIDDTYKPRFSGGYVAPVGSTVYYNNSSWLDWLPFYMIMTNQQHRQATVTQPDGEKKIVKEEGTDNMYVLNWIITIFFVGGTLGGIVYIINKYTYKNEYE